MNKELKNKIETEVKTFAKNNLCASCYDDMDEYIDDMEDVICGDIYDCYDSSVMNECIRDLEYVGIEIDDDVRIEVLKILKKEAKYWLSDYKKHKKDYE